MYTGCCGLIIISELPYGKARVDLENSNVDISVNGFVANISVELSYKNYSEKAVEVAYVFPLDVRTAVYSFEATLDGRTITAHCLEKKKAKKVYDKAVEEGHTAILGSEDRFSGDVIHLALGNFPKGETADLKLKMVLELPLKVDGAVDFTLPTVFNPRYSPPNQQSGPEFFRPVLDSSVIPNKTPYSLNVKAEIQGNFKIAQIKSLSDPINVHIDDDGTSAKITQDGGVNFDHDWSFQIYYQTVHKPHCLQMSGDRSSSGLMKDDILMLNLFPEVPIEDYSPHNEIILVVDRSGSMTGSKIAKATTTLLLFLKSLPPGCRFNVVSFGSTFSTLFQSSSERYTESTLKKAMELQSTMGADMGGTEIFSALHHIYSMKLIPGYPRQIIVLTDGQVWNQDQIFDLIQRNAEETRVFSVGIGDGASTALVEGMAKAGRGRCEMVLHEDQLQMRVMGLIGSMLQDNVKDLSIECKVTPPQDVRLVPKIPPSIFGGQHLILYARLKPDSKIVSMKINWLIGSVPFSCELNENDCKLVHDSNLSFHRLAAKAQLNQWIREDDETFNEDIVNLSVASSVVCKLTSFVGFDQEKKIICERVRKEFPAQGSCFSFGSNYKSGLRSKSRSVNLASNSPSPMAFGSLFGSNSLVHPTSAGGGAALPKMTPPPMARGFGQQQQPQALSFGSSGQGIFISNSNLENLDKQVEILAKGHFSFGSDVIVNQVDEKDALIDIISAQRFDGFWTLQECIKFLNLNQDLCNNIQTKLSLSDNLLATVLILAFLQLKFESRKDEWKFVSVKGRNFLKANNIDPSDVVQKCFLQIKDKL